MDGADGASREARRTAAFVAGEGAPAAGDGVARADAGGAAAGAAAEGSTAAAATTASTGAGASVGSACTDSCTTSTASNRGASDVARRFSGGPAVVAGTLNVAIPKTTAWTVTDAPIPATKMRR